MEHNLETNMTMVQKKRRRNCHVLDGSMTHITNGGESIMPLGRNRWQGHISQSLSVACIRIVMICTLYLRNTYL